MAFRCAGSSQATTPERTRVAKQSARNNTDGASAKRSLAARGDFAPHPRLWRTMGHRGQAHRRVACRGGRPVAVAARAGALCPAQGRSQARAAPDRARARRARSSSRRRSRASSRVPWVSLYHVDFSRSLLNLVAREAAEKYCLVPIFVRRVRKQGETLYVAMDDPTNDAAIEDVARAASLPVKPMIACPSDIRAAIRVYYLGEAAPPPPAPGSTPQVAALAPAAPPAAAPPSPTQLGPRPAPPPPPDRAPARRPRRGRAEPPAARLKMASVARPQGGGSAGPRAVRGRPRRRRDRSPGARGRA